MFGLNLELHSGLKVKGSMSLNNKSARNFLFEQLLFDKVDFAASNSKPQEYPLSNVFQQILPLLFRTTEKQGNRQVLVDRLKTDDANLDCVFIRKHIFYTMILDCENPT